MITGTRSRTIQHCIKLLSVAVCTAVYRGAALGNQYGPGSGTIWLDDVQCLGTETSLHSCQHNGWGDHPHCSHSDDVSIACYGISTPT